MIRLLPNLSDGVMHGEIMMFNGWDMLSGGFRRAFLSEGHGIAKRESAVGVPPNPAL